MTRSVHTCSDALSACCVICSRVMHAVQLADFELEHAGELRDLRLQNYLAEQRVEIRANADFVRHGVVELFDYLDARERAVDARIAAGCRMD